jgi:uncharacterized protein YndB with AHSA1/START domain
MRKVESSILIHQPASVIFDAFTNRESLKAWWGVERCLVDRRQGGVYSLTWGISDKGFHYISTGIITVFQPGKELLIDHFIYFNPDIEILGPTWLSIKLEELNSQETILHLTQGGYQSGKDWDWFYHSVQDAWPKVLVQLKKFLEQQD